MEQLMNIGQFVAAEIIILLIIGSVEKLVLSIETIYDVLTGLEKIGQVTDLELEDNQGIDLSKDCAPGAICLEMDGVQFTYPGAEQPTLKNISLQVKAGDRVMIAGRNGSGKSTLLQLMAGLYDTELGVLTYQGISKQSVSLDSLRSIMGDCLSQEQLFEGTLLENITLGNPNIGIVSNRLMEILHFLNIMSIISILFSQKNILT